MLLLPLCGALLGGTIFTKNTYITKQEETVQTLTALSWSHESYSRCQVIIPNEKLVREVTWTSLQAGSSYKGDLLSKGTGTKFHMKVLAENLVFTHLSLARTGTSSMHLVAYICIVELTAGLVTLSQHTPPQWPLHCSLQTLHCSHKWNVTPTTGVLV